jgi:hypothetical protein
MISKLLNTGNRRWLMLFPLLGLIILLILVNAKPPPQLKSTLALAPLVHIEAAKMRPLQMTIKGYGRAQSKERWQAVAEVSGRVIFRHPGLEKGSMLPAGTRALQIDPVDYQLKLAQAKSDLKSAIADADRIGLTKNKQSLSLDLENNRLKLLEKELKRKQGLVKKGSISRSLVDQEQSNVFAQQQKVLDLTTRLQLIPNDVDVAQARIQVNQSRVKEAQRKLDKTAIIIPFDARITQVYAELDQVINLQAILLKANHIGAMEIPAQFSFNDLKQLIGQARHRRSAQESEFPDIKQLNLQADIKLYSGNDIVQWPGRVSRVSDSIDAQGNTIALIIEMENDWKHFDPFKRPPVLNDMFVEVNVKAQTTVVLSVPTKAIHGDKIYIVQDGLLSVKPISILFESGEYSALDSQLPGTISVDDFVITTDLLPAIDKMNVRAVMELAP